MIRSISLRVAALLALVAVTAMNWPIGTQANSYGPLAIMPAIHTGGGALSEFGLHFDEADSEMGAYDYSAGGGTNAWIRARANGDQPFPTRYKYWKESDCDVRARLQLQISGVWYDYYQYDLRLIHVYRTSPGTQHTQAVQYTNDWLYHSVGQVVYAPACPPNTGDHVHLSGRVHGDGWLVIGPKSNDTCWSDSVQCNTVMSMFKRLHSFCPSSWSGWTQQRSGTVAQYICATWQLMTRDDETAAFLKN
jgi:hypothetical protein